MSEQAAVSLELVSFTLCPFVQKVAIALEHKKVSYTITYIDLANPPEWFLQKSPLRKVPLLFVKETDTNKNTQEHVLFESSVISEYVEDQFAPKLHPENLVARAKARSWIEYASPCMVHSYMMSVTKQESEYLQHLSDLHKKLDQLESNLQHAPYWSGAQFSLVDAAYAPVFQRLWYLQSMINANFVGQTKTETEEIATKIYDPARHPKITAWARALAEVPAVQKSCVANIQELYEAYVREKEGYVWWGLASPRQN